MNRKPYILALVIVLSLNILLSLSFVSLYKNSLYEQRIDLLIAQTDYLDNELRKNIAYMKVIGDILSDSDSITDIESSNFLTIPSPVSTIT